MKKIFGLLLLPLLFSGCNATLTNLTPLRQVRTTNNLYNVEVAVASRQQTMRWHTIKPYVIVGERSFPMTQTPLMTNRWEAMIPVSPEKNTVNYHYKFDFDYNTFGKPQSDSTKTADYTLQIIDKQGAQ